MAVKHEEHNYNHPPNDPYLWLKARTINRLYKN